ncbi:Uncharacterised protein [Chlamydia trachomatis]|nr:Uncharacterised protein [Chlamydia trachomatis]
MNRDQVLTHDAHGNNTRNDAPFRHGTNAFTSRRVSALHLRNKPVGKQLRQAGMRNRHGEGAKQSIGKRDLRATSEAILEGDHRAFNAHMCGQTRNQSSNEQGDNDMHARNRKREHDDD